jgi:hypothetical protein
MLSAFVYEELLVHSATKAVLRKHTLYGYFYNLVWAASYEALCSFGTLTTWIASVGHVFLILHLIAGKDNLAAIDYDNVIAAVEVRRIICLVLATEYVSNPGSHTAQSLVGGINHIPIALYDLLVGRLGFKAEVSHDVLEVFPAISDIYSLNWGAQR